MKNPKTGEMETENPKNLIRLWTNKSKLMTR